MKTEELDEIYDRAKERLCNYSMEITTEYLRDLKNNSMNDYVIVTSLMDIFVLCAAVKPEDHCPTCGRELEEK